MSDDPKFDSIAAWSNEALVRFSQDAYTRMKLQQEAIEQLRLDLKAAMQELRKYQDDWK